MRDTPIFQTSDGYVEPINVDFPLKHLLDINKIEVVIWNLKEYLPHTIEAIEEEVIETIFPFVIQRLQS